MRIAPATPDHPTEPLARLMWDEDPGVMVHLFGTPARWQAVLAREWPATETHNCHATTLLAQDGGATVGLMNGFPAAQFDARYEASLALYLDGLDDAEQASLEARLGEVEELMPLPDPADFYILDIAVAAGHRGRGVGRALMAEAEAAARAAGCAGLCLDVAADNPAVGFYRRMGFGTAYASPARHGLNAHIQMRRALPPA